MKNFSNTAWRLWEKVPANARIKILNSVWCSHCRCSVTMLHAAGRVEGGCLVLRGKCEHCKGVVVRIIENEQEKIR